jgi:hypothetical protein
MTQAGAVILVMVSLIEVTFYLSAVNGIQAMTPLISMDMIHAVQHLFSMVAAPVVFLPLSAVILSSRVLPRGFGYAGLAIGGLFAVMGILVLFYPWQYMVDDLAFGQALWWLAAAITLLFRPARAGSDTFVAGSHRM